jgi:hypothetical protein
MAAPAPAAEPATAKVWDLESDQAQAAAPAAAPIGQEAASSLRVCCEK